MEKQYAVLINGIPRQATKGGIRTYKTRERAIKENQFYKNIAFYKDNTIEVAEVAFINREEI